MDTYIYPYREFAAADQKFSSKGTIRMDRKLRDEVRQLHAQVCKALADPSRILLLYSLTDQPRTVGELAAINDLPQPTVSRHLRILRERGLVTADRVGQSVVYELSDRRIIKALDLLRAVIGDNLQMKADLASSVHESLKTTY